MYIVKWSNKEAEAYEDLLPDWIFRPEWNGGQIHHRITSAGQRGWDVSCVASKSGQFLYLDYPPEAADTKSRFSGTLRIEVSDGGKPLVKANWKEPNGNYAPIAKVRDGGTAEMGLVSRTMSAKVRIQQAKFAAEVVNHWGDACALTGITLTPLLQACHIKSFGDPQTTDQERISGDNGIRLAVHVHALFDNGLISFDDDGQVRWSAAVDIMTRRSLALPDKLDAAKLTPAHRENLAYHRAINGFDGLLNTPSSISVRRTTQPRRRP